MGIGHWASGIGHWAWGIGHGAWGTCASGIGHRAWGIGHLCCPSTTLRNRVAEISDIGKKQKLFPIPHAPCPIPHSPFPLSPVAFDISNGLSRNQNLFF
ncbi:MAG TPA: hypothetical protein DGO89_19810 [Microcoleaceae bacterium UBA9251]|nr:hypothetical protein [Microcoleaceae cyanobacterium UBA9251]